MRTLKKLVQVLVVAALLVIPAVAISAQSGDIYIPPNLPAPNETELTIGEMTPSVLPETGTSPEEAFSFAPQASVDYGKALRDAYAELRSTGEVVAPTTLPSTGYDGAKALRDAYAQLRSTGEVVAPSSLPMTGADLLTGHYPQTILDQTAASGGITRGVWSGATSRSPVDLGGITGPERQTIIDQLTASGVSVASSQPEALPQTGIDLSGSTGQDGLKRLDPTQDCRWC
jgi:hypothetical protein